MLAEKILGNMRDNDLEKKINKQVVSVDFEWFELEKKRIRKVAGDGTEIGICIPEFLKEGDIIGETEQAIYVVKIMESRLIRIPVHTITEMGRLGFELGNRHLSLRITENEVYVPYDKPTYEYLLKMGFQAEDITGQFTDFIQCKAHSHGHSHEHSHEHSHHHGHEHSHHHGHAQESDSEE